jgi:hypothetical protein
MKDRLGLELAGRINGIIAGDFGTAEHADQAPDGMIMHRVR